MNQSHPPESEVYVIQRQGVMPAEGMDNETGTMGMAIFLLSLSVLFAASLVGYFVIRFQSESWPPPGMPGLPSGLWLSTLLILISSVTIQGAVFSVRNDSLKLMCGFLVITTILGCGFLACQILNWRGLLASQVPPTANLYAYTFYTLTGLHAAHVIGGLFHLFIVTIKAFQGRYWSLSYPGVRYAAMYWHFLDVVWLILFTALVVFG